MNHERMRAHCARTRLTHVTLGGGLVVEVAEARGRGCKGDKVVVFLGRDRAYRAALLAHNVGGCGLARLVGSLRAKNNTGRQEGALGT